MKKIPKEDYKSLDWRLHEQVSKNFKWTH